jgi:hypothetical protein
MCLSVKFGELHLAVSELDVLATIVAERFKDQSWSHADPVVVSRTDLLLGALARAATTAGSKLDLFAIALEEARFGAPDEWSRQEDTAAPTSSGPPDR